MISSKPDEALEQIFVNPRWTSSIIFRSKESFYDFQVKRNYYWVNYAYKFEGLERNEEYLEKDEEFDEV